MLSDEQLGRLHEYLVGEWADARDAYLAAEHLALEEFHRGRREALDAVMSRLDELTGGAS